MGQILRLGEKPYMSPGPMRPRGECPMPDVYYAMLPDEVGRRQFAEHVSRSVQAITSSYVSAIRGYSGGNPPVTPVGLSMLSGSGQQAGSGLNTVSALPLTVWAVVRPQAWTNIACVVAGRSNPGGNDKGWVLAYTSSSVLLQYADGTGTTDASYRRATATTTMSVGTWYVLAGVVRSETDMSIWLNGLELPVSYTGSGGAISLGANSYIGWGVVDGAARYKNMDLIGVAAWNRALTPAQVAAHYRDPYMWWRDERRVFYSIPAGGIIVPAALIRRYRQPASAVGGGS